MHNDIRLHGFIDKHIEYYAIVAGNDAHNRFFFNTDQGDGKNLRFFCPGSEFIIGTESISHYGNGGSFCEYMFGVDQPLPTWPRETSSIALSCTAHVTTTRPAP